MAGRYSEEIIEEVRNAVDLVEIASRYVRLKKSGNSYMGCCPFHKEKTPSFHIDADKQLYHCFGCGAGGSVFQFVMNAEGMDFIDAVKSLADSAGIRLPELGPDGGEERYRRKQDMYAMNKDAARFFRDCLFSEEGAGAREYFRRRALTSKTVASFGLGYSPTGWDGLLKHLEAMGYPRDMMVEAGLCIRNDRGRVYDRFRGRVMFPIFDARSNLIGFAGRIMEGEGAKYVNSPESIIYDKGKNLFALNLARKSRRGYYILVEGYMDVISLHQAGIDCAVAGCGTALTEAQAKLIARGNTVYLCYDMDEAGKKARDRAFSIFKGLDAKLRVITIPDGKDADEFIKKYGGEQFEKLLGNASTVTGNRVDALLSKYDLTDVSQKVELINEAADIFAGIPNMVEREAYIRDMAVKTGISFESISAEVRKAGGRRQRNEVLNDVRRSVSSSRTVQEGRREGRREASERRLLGLICGDGRLYKKLKDNLTEDLFSTEIHRDIFRTIKESCDSGIDAQQQLMKSYRGREEELSSVLIVSDDPQNALAAAEDYIRIIKEEAMREMIAEAEKSGDVALLAELLKNNRKAGM
ncbi:MAG: DNA primase [Oscillospiraceae bacterium]|nr:DNA primase [Oscillospiraceae bacterium]